MKKTLNALSSPLLMTFLLVLLIVSLAAATFIENDFGSAVARIRIYNAKWFELILVLLSINLIARVITLKLYKPAKFSVFLFHIAFVIMIIGAGITRYFGDEGSMHIREGKASSVLITNEKLIEITVENEPDQTTIHQFNSNIEFNQVFKEKIKIDDKKIEVKLFKFYNSASKRAMPTHDGKPIIGFVVAGDQFRGFDYLTDNEAKKFGPLTVAFNHQDLANNADIILNSVNETVFIESPHPIMVSEMGAESAGAEIHEKIELEPRKIYRINNYNFVLQEFFPQAGFVAVPPNSEGHSQGMRAMVFNIHDGTNRKELTLWENEWGGKPVLTELGNLKVGIRYINRTIELPFSLYLNDFVIERYPGSMSPSSFASFVTILDGEKAPRPYHIYMNNILKYRGYRFFQSSYDQDELGTILSVNHDQWGTLTTYFGYFIMLLGILWSLVNKNTFFRKTIIKDKTLLAFILLFALSTGVNAQGKSTPTRSVPIDKKHAEAFGKLHIQNHMGRTEPIFTYSSELLRKISRTESLNGLSPVQVFMEMNMNPEEWVDMPMIRVSNKELQAHLGITGKFAAYSDFITPSHGYVLQKMVQSVYALPAAQRSKFEKAIIKTDEKVNICYSIFTGGLLKIFPVPGNPDSTKWYPSSEASMLANNEADSVFLSNMLPAYFNELEKAKQTADYSLAGEYLQGLKKFQQTHAGYELPSVSKTNVEIFYQKLNPFKKLFPFYATLGLFHLFLLIAFIVMAKQLPKWINTLFYTVVMAGFVVHTIGVAARWYISGHAPMSNGYESLVFISWVTVLAGFFFHKKSQFSLTATVFLAGLTLMVANLSFMDPVITNLVPVLQSYWLTIHVSVITASYGFLALGALLGIINQLMIIFLNSKNQQRILETIENLTVINHKSLILGLYMLTIGTFLGAVWANESWGRYWGWDPKETWALISILVYTLVTHARLIPGMKGVFMFNVLSLYAFASILMTYFGVNYYLSGLHSYAGGDPVPVPSFVYYTTAAFLLLTSAATLKYEKINKLKMI